MDDVILLAVVHAVATHALIANASSAHVELSVTNLLLEGVVDVLFAFAGSHVARWLGNGALVIIWEVVDLDLLLANIILQPAWGWVARAHSVLFSLLVVT